MKVYCQDCKYYQPRFGFECAVATQHDCLLPKNMRTEIENVSETFLHPAHKEEGCVWAGKADEINKNNNCPDFKRRGILGWF